MNQNEYKVNNHILFFEWTPTYINNKRIRYVQDLDSVEHLHNVADQNSSLRKNFNLPTYSDRDSLISSTSTMRENSVIEIEMNPLNII